MEVKVNIVGDYAQILRKRLLGIGYSKSSVDNLRDEDSIILAYLRACRRLVSNVPRAIFKAKGFVCPPEHIDALAQIERKIRIGENIGPYLSRKPFNKIGYNDALLNDWGIQHLHLGTSVSTNPKHRGLLIEAQKRFCMCTLSKSARTSLRYSHTKKKISRCNHFSKQCTKTGRVSWLHSTIRTLKEIVLLIRRFSNYGERGVIFASLYLMERPICL